MTLRVSVRGAQNGSQVDGNNGDTQLGPNQYGAGNQQQQTERESSKGPSYGGLLERNSETARAANQPQNYSNEWPDEWFFRWLAWWLGTSGPAEWVTALATLGAVVAAGFTLANIRTQSIAATTAAETGVKTLVMIDRPWLSVNIQLTQVIQFSPTNNEIGLRFRCVVTNHGRSVGEHLDLKILGMISPHALQPNAPIERLRDVVWQTFVSWRQHQRPELGFVCFPSESINREWQVVISRTELDAYWATLNLLPSLALVSRPIPLLIYGELTYRYGSLPINETRKTTFGRDLNKVVAGIRMLPSAGTPVQQLESAISPIGLDQAT